MRGFVWNNDGEHEKWNGMTIFYDKKVCTAQHPPTQHNSVSVFFTNSYSWDVYHVLIDLVGEIQLLDSA